MTPSSAMIGKVQTSDTGHKWRILAVLAVVLAVGGTDMTKIVIGLPHMTADLDAGPAEALWIADGYALATGVALVPSAVLADRFGRKRMYLVGLLVAVLSAVVASFADWPGALIAARLGQGVGAAMIIACTVAIIRVTFTNPHQRAVAYGAWTASFSAGSAVGPILGGVLVELGGWQWVFAVNVPVILLCLFAAGVIMDESRNPDPPTLDIYSAAFSAAAIGLIIAGLKLFPSQEAPTPVAGAMMVCGVMVLAAFVHRQFRLNRPFLDVRLFRSRPFATAAVAIAVTNGTFAGILFVLTQRMQVVYEFSGVETGLVLLPLAAASVAGGLTGPVVQRLSGRYSSIMVGQVLVSIGVVLLATMDATVPVAAMVLTGMGAGIVMTSGADTVMSSVSIERTGDAGAVQEVAFAIGAGSGIAVLGTAAAYLAGTAGAASPVDIYTTGYSAAIGIASVMYCLFAVVTALLLITANNRRTS